MPGIYFPDLPSYTEMKKFSNRNSRWGPDHGVDIHHSVDKSLQEKWFMLTGNPDDVPGFVIDNKVHTFGPQRGLSGTLTGDIFDELRNRNVRPGDHYNIALAMRKVYVKYGFDDLWIVARQTLVSKGITNLPP